MQKQIGPIAAALAAFTLAVSGTLADTYTWNSSGTAWNTTDAVWLNGSGQAAVWEDGNDAVFGSGSMNKWPCPNGTRTANNITINAAGYTLGWGLLEVSGKFTANADCTLGERFGFAGDSVRIGGPSGKTIWTSSLATNSTHRLTYLEDSIRLNATDDRFFGVVPAVPSDNIVVESGSPLLTAASAMSLDANRSIRIAGGAVLRFSATTGNALVVKGVISGESDASLGFVTTNCISLPYYTGTPYGSAVTSGTIVLDPGEQRTNDVGRLHIQSSLKLSSGTTRVGNAKHGGTGAEAPLYVQGDNTDFSATRGNLVVDGATLYNSQTGDYRYIHIDAFGQVTVRNGGRIDMPGVHWLNMKGRLSVGDGEFVANVLRVSQSAASEINLDEGGLIAVNKLGIDPAGTHACQFKFNGGRIQSRNGSGSFLGTVTTTATTDADWASVVFSVGGKGAGFDTTNGQNIHWTQPLTSAPEAGVADGGVFVLGSDSTVGVIFSGAATNSSYTGSTVISKAMVKYSQKCALSGRYEFCGDASGCGRLSVAAGQSISGIEIGGAGLASLSTDAPGGTYKILDAPDGFSGEFALAADFPSDKWRVRYTANAAYLSPVKATTIIMR